MGAAERRVQAAAGHARRRGPLRRHLRGLQQAVHSMVFVSAVQEWPHTSRWQGPTELQVGAGSATLCMADGMPSYLSVKLVNYQQAWT